MCLLTSMKFYLGIIIVSGGASCNGMFSLFSLIRETSGMHGDHLALHYITLQRKVVWKMCIFLCSY